MKCLNRPQEGPANRPYFAYKIFRDPEGQGVFSTWISPGNINVIDENMELGCARSI